MGMFFGVGFGKKKEYYSITGAPCGVYLRHGGCGDGKIIPASKHRRAFSDIGAAKTHAMGLTAPNKKAHITFLV